MFFDADHVDGWISSCHFTSFILSTELWHLLPEGDDVVSILEANGRPIFTAMEPVKYEMLVTAE